MKLDGLLDLWFAWQDGDEKTLSSILNLLLKNNYFVGILPSEKWESYKTQNLTLIIRVVMLSSSWIFDIDNKRFYFRRGHGPPSGLDHKTFCNTIKVEK